MIQNLDILFYTKAHTMRFNPPRRNSFHIRCITCNIIIHFMYYIPNEKEGNFQLHDCFTKRNIIIWCAIQTRKRRTILTE